MKKKIGIIGIIITVVIIISILFFYYCNKNEKNDYSLVFNAKYYAENNLDIKEAVGDDEKDLLNHFLEYGMKEGRVGVENFDVKYYRENNPDLAEAFGEDLPLYYKHYIEFGNKEGRKGSSEDVAQVKYDAKLQCKLKKDGNLILSVKFESKEKNQTFYILEMPAYENCFENSNIVSEFKNCSKKEFKINPNSVTNKYVVVKLKDNKYEQISNIAYIQNPEVLCKIDNSKNQITPKSKKGLQIRILDIDNAENLEPSYCFFNFYIQEILLMEYVENNTITYEYAGNTYYFNKETIEQYDGIISRLTNNNYCIIASLINIKEEGYDPLYYSNISMDTGASYYAVNTAEKAGEQYFEAFVSFISNRYNGTKKEYGLISKWTVGNEINDNKIYNYMGEKDIEDYLDEYIRTFRIAYNIIKTNNSFAGIYVPMEPWWGIDSDMLIYGGREFLTVFNEKMKQSGDIDWGLAYHAYSYPLGDPKVLNDDIAVKNEAGYVYKDGVTKDSFYTATITMKNIDVLTDFMKQEEFLAPNGEVRSIILSEQGYTSNSHLYGNCEAQQAASMLYAYYKAEMNKYIEAFIYFLQFDNSRASLGNEYYKFGLTYINDEGEINKKLSYDIFKNMDKKDSLERFSYFKNILGINEYSDVISNFDSKVFDKFDESNEKTSDKTNISSAQIVKIENQKYTGEECLPEVIVKFDENVLINDVDYDVVYLNNIEVGEATAVIVGLDKYEGVKEIKFLIEK